MTRIKLDPESAWGITASYDDGFLYLTQGGEHGRNVSSILLTEREQRRLRDFLVKEVP